MNHLMTFSAPFPKFNPKPNYIRLVVPLRSRDSLKNENRDPGCRIAFRLGLEQGGLFYRLKKRTGDLLQLEFKQTIYKDSGTGKWHVDE
jgi:hypothetical protein